MISGLKDTLLIVSDEAEERARQRGIFESSFNILEAENLCQATMLMEQNAACIVSAIVDLKYVDAVKRSEEELKEKAERDGLTKLYNKVSAQKLITEYLAGRKESALAAMLLLDMDNFKLINDNYGHLYGDSVLEQIGAGLRKLFRSNDIVGRIGGDEFLILMKDIPDAELVHSRCRRLLGELHRLLEERCPGLDISGSVGVVLIPDHGTGYSDLFRRADEALYHSKISGKDTYTLYDPKNAGNEVFAGKGNVSTRIETDRQTDVSNASFMKYVFRRLYESSNIIETVGEIIAVVGEQFGVSRVYIFENNEDNTTCSNTFEWCNEGITPERDNLQNVSYVDDIAGWPDVFDENGIFYCTDISVLSPHFRAILEPQGIKSMLQCSILDNGVFRGYVGFDECVVQRMWTQEQIELLQLLSEVMAMFLLKQRARDRIEEQVENLRSILDSQDAWIYVVDPETCKLKYINEKIRRSAPECREETICYKSLLGRDSRCENCPAAGIRKDRNTSVMMESEELGGRVWANVAQIKWNGKNECLMTFRGQAD